MTGMRPQLQPSSSAAAPHAAADLSDVVARLLMRDKTIAAGTSGNVIVLSPARRPHASAPEIRIGQRPAPTGPAAVGRLQAAGLLAASLAVHAAALLWFERAPPPRASVGEVSVSVEIVLGTQVAAGEANTPSLSEVQSAASPEADKPDAETPQTARAEPDPPEQAEAPPPEPEPQAAPVESEPAPAETKAVAESAATAPDPQPAPAEPEPAAVAAPPNPPEQSAAAPAPPVAPDGELPAPAESSEMAPPLPQPRPAVRKIEREPERRQAERTERPRAARPKPQRFERGENPATRHAPASQASVASSGIGLGRSDADSNYRGRVAAHLARHKQFPAEARARGDQGSTTVTFSIDGNGRVTSVRLTRSSGIASFDRETEAMVRRASPFPAPPNGRPMTFTVPISFHLR